MSGTPDPSELVCHVCCCDLVHDDTFGNLDYCMVVIGHPSTVPRHPVKAGDIYRCPECGQSYYTYDGDDEVREGYPC